MREIVSLQFKSFFVLAHSFIKNEIENFADQNIDENLNSGMIFHIF